MGAGYSWMMLGKDGVFAHGANDSAKLAHDVLGLTGQVKLGRRVALNADFTMVNNVRQDRNFDGSPATSDRGFDGTLYNATLGLSFYLGGHDQHADWFVTEDMIEGRVASLEN